MGLGMGLQVPFAHYLLVTFFFVTATIYLQRLRPIKLIKQNLVAFKVRLSINLIITVSVLF